MAMGQMGGIRSDYIMVHFPKGSSWKYGTLSKHASDELLLADKNKNESNRPAYAKVKHAVALFFNMPIVTMEDMLKSSTRSKNLTYNGKSHKSQSLSKIGATGRGRAVKVYFKTVQTIGKKKVASVNIAMPPSYTMGNMIKYLMSTQNGDKIASIVSPLGQTWTFAARYKPKKK
jgi:sorbitol-specific phosphotransferase system component IIBC